MSGGANLGVQAFSYGLDKGYDRLPNQIFLTPKERKERKRRQRQQEQQQGGGQPGPQQGQAGGPGGQPPTASPTSPQSGQFYNRPEGPDNNPNDPYAPRGQRGSRDSPYSPAQQQQNSQFANPDNQHAIDDQPYYQDGYMQGDGYYQQQGGRRSYNPQDYQPRGGYENGYDDGYARDAYGMNNRDQYGRSASAGRVDRYRPQSYGGNYNDYDDYYDDDYDDRRQSRRDRRSSKSKSRQSEQSQPGIKGKLDKNFDYRSEKGLTAGALGALAGGLVGHEVGKGPLATVAGVVIGGLGANAFEARNERKDTEKNEQAFGSRRSKSSDGYDRYRGGGSGSGGGRGRGQKYDDDYDSYDEDAEQGARQRRSKNKSRSRGADDGGDDKIWNWNNILKS